MEPQKPSDPKPAGPKPTGPAPSSSKPWVSPRLREKLGDQPPVYTRGGGGGDGGGRHDDGLPGWVGMVLAVLVIGGGAALFFTIQSGAARDKAKAVETARLAREAATAESLVAVAHADSMRLAMAAAESLRVLTGGKPKPAPKPTAAATPPPAGGATPAPAPPPAEPGPFGLDVGTFLVEDRAASEQARIAAATGLAGKVVTMNEDGSDVYHVVMGSFPTRAAAERKAASLVGAGQVNQARAIPLK